MPPSYNQHMNESTAESFVSKYSSAVIAAMASGGIYLLAWCYEYGYSVYLGLPWQSDVVLSRYCVLFVITAMFMSLAYFIPFGDWSDTERSFRDWKWPTWLQVVGASLLALYSIGYTVIYRINPETIPTLLIICSLLAGFAFARFVLVDRFKLRTRVSFSGLAIIFLCYSSYLVGVVSPGLKYVWPTFVDVQDDTWIILEKQDSYFISAKIDRDNGVYVPEFVLRPADDDIVIRRQRFDRIRPSR